MSNGSLFKPKTASKNKELPKRDEKICPLDPDGRQCLESRCGWWYEEEKCCAVLRPLIIIGDRG